jgi:hypothetical protein
MGSLQYVLVLINNNSAAHITFVLVQEFPIGMVYFSRQIVSQLKSKTTTIQHGATVALAKWAKYSKAIAIL